MATPALRALRRGRPHDEIIAVVRSELASLFAGCPWIDRLLPHEVYGARSAPGRLLRRVALGRELRGCDTVIVLPNSWSGALVAFVSRAHRRIGYARRRRSWLLSEVLPAPRVEGRFIPTAMHRYYLDLVCSMGCPDTGTDIELFTSPEGEKECDRIFAEHGIDSARPLVCLAPGAGFGPSKLWPLSYVADVASTLLADGARVALVHGPGEDPLADEILARTGPEVASLGGRDMSLALLVSVIARAQLLICNDAGARHIAAAFGVPALVMMGPTSIHYTNLNLNRTRLMREPVECSPCHLKVCPIDHRCMTRILPQRVIDEARAVLSDPEWRGDLELELPS